MKLWFRFEPRRFRDLCGGLLLAVIASGAPGANASETAVQTATSSLQASSPGQIRIYLSNDDHTDYMWTADADAYESAFIDMLDFQMRLTDETINNPQPYQNRFNVDGSFWLWTYERRKTPAEFARLIDHIRSGHLSAPLNALVSCYGAQPTEAVLRGMYYAGRLERRHGLRFTQAVAMENQTLPLGLASLWAGSGAKYSWRGVCGCASRTMNSARAEREHEIYWYTGLDGQRVLMKWHTVGPGNQSIGGYAEAFDPVQAVQFLDSDADFLSRYRPPGATEPYGARAAFGFGWDALARKTGEPYAANPEDYPLTEHFHIIAQAETTPRRQIVVSNQEDFFADFAKHHGTQLPNESLTYGNEWEIYSASMVETSARVRRAVEKLRAAEALATVVGLHDPALLDSSDEARDAAFMALGLYWEHDWTADGPIVRPLRAAWQEELADTVESYVDTLQHNAAQRLSTLIPRPDQRLRFYAFNPLGWTRTDAVDFAYDGRDDVHVYDLAADAETPHQFITLDGVRHLRILARDLPPIGYKVFEVRAGAGNDSSADAATFSDNVFENERVKLALDRDGAINSFVAKDEPEAELAATIDGLKLNDFAANESGSGAISLENRGPVSVTVRIANRTAPHHTVRITLYRDSDRVDIRNEITENFGDVRHWSFSFNLAAPEVRSEELGTILRLRKKSDGGDYAERNARYDYATLNHFADISDPVAGRGVTLSNWDCAFVRLGRSTPEKFDTSTAQLHVLAGGQVDGDRLGIRDQNGASHFLQRFALRAHRGYDPVAAMRFAVEHQNPPVTGSVTGGGEAPLSATHDGLLTVSDPRVLIWIVKPAEEGIAHGVIARLWNLSDAPVRATLAFTRGLSSARSITHIETDLENVPLDPAGTLSSEFARQQLRTFRLVPK